MNYSGTTTRTLSPGTYVGGIHVRGRGSIILLPGIYYLRGGGLHVSDSGSLTGTGVLIVNAPATGDGQDDGIALSSKRNVTLGAPLPGNLPSGYAAYKGITIFQDPASTVPIKISDDGGLTMDGALYAPKATLNISGNSGLTDNTDTTAPVAEVIVYDVHVTGNSSLTINADAPASNPSANSPLPGAAQATFTSFVSSANPAVPGQPVTFTATLTSSAGPPAGLVDFFDLTTHLDLGSVTLSGGVATLTTPAPRSLGSHVISANYFSASPNFAAPAPATLTQQVQSTAIEGGILYVGGTPSSNDIHVQVNNSQVVVKLKPGAPAFQTPLAGLTALVVYDQGNGANIEVDRHLLLPSYLFGGNGTNTEVEGGGGPTVEVGGGGGGRLQGGAGATS